MYVIEPALCREQEIYLYCCGRLSRTFYGLDHLCEELSVDFIEKWVGEHYGEQIKIVTKRAHGLHWPKDRAKWEYQFPEEFYIEPAMYIVRTDEGEKLTSDFLKKACSRFYYNRRAARLGYYKPRMGRKTRGCYGNYRAPKTTNEKRQAFCIKEDGEPSIRARRNITNLTDAWDDTSRHNDACWKTQYKKRKRQYRPK